MAIIKKILTKKFNGRPAGASIRIHENQLEYFIEQGLIEGKVKKTKTKKTETKVEADIDKNKIN